MNSPRWALWIFLCLVLGMRGIASTNIYTPIMMFINNSVPKTFIGRANGTGQAIVAFMRGTSPAFAGFLWSKTTEIDFHLNSYINFFVVCLLVTITFVLTYFYIDEIEKPLESRKLIQFTMNQVKSSENETLR